MDNINVEAESFVHFHESHHPNFSAEAAHNIHERYFLSWV